MAWHGCGSDVVLCALVLHMLGTKKENMKHKKKNPGANDVATFGVDMLIGNSVTDKHMLPGNSVTDKHMLPGNSVTDKHMLPGNSVTDKHMLPGNSVTDKQIS